MSRPKPRDRRACARPFPPMSRTLEEVEAAVRGAALLALPPDERRRAAGELLGWGWRRPGDLDADAVLFSRLVEERAP
jgi:hypothetical protein